MMPAKHVVQRFYYDATEHGLDEDGSFEGFWTGEQDEWGKLTIRRVDGGPAHYLFEDEITELEEVN